MPTGANAIESVPQQDQCQYPSKPCHNKRAQKSNGELHRFCEFHRRKANLNQQRWSRGRRQIQPCVRYEPDLEAMTNGRATTLLGYPPSVLLPAFNMEYDPLQATAVSSPPVNLKAEDIQVLTDLFLHDTRCVEI